MSHHNNKLRPLRWLPILVCGLALFCNTVNAREGNRETLRFVDRETAEPLAGVVILPAETDNTDDAPGSHRMVQKNRAFDPHVLVVSQGAEVNFPNEDNTQHHVYSFSAPKPFNIELYSGQPEAPIMFDKPGIVELGCNIHDQMQAFVVVTGSSSHTLQSNAEGRVTFDEPLAGKNELQVWHPRLEDNSQPVRIRLESELAGEQLIRLQVNPEQETDSRLDALQKRFRDL